MEASCDSYRTWLIEADHGVPMPPDVSAHLVRCRECRDLDRAYTEAVDLARETLDERAPAGPDMRSIRAALAAGTRFPPAPGRAVNPYRHVLWAAPAAAVLVMLAWHSLVADRNPRPETAGGAGSPATAGISPVGMSPGPTGPGPVAGQVVETGDSDVALSDAKVGQLRLSPHSVARVVAWGPGRTVLFLDRGSLDAIVVHRDAGGHFEVRTDYAVIQAVGTRFRVEHAPWKETGVTCIEGVVRVDTFAGVEIGMVAAGQSMRIGASGILGPGAPGKELAMVNRPRDISGRREGIAAGATREARDQDAPRAGVAAVAAPDDAPAAEMVLKRARQLIMQGRARDAASLLEGYVAGSATDRHRVLALLGDAYRLGGDLEEARAAYEGALAAGSGPGIEGVYADLASLLGERMRRRDDAADVWKRYLTAFPRGRYASRALCDMAGRAEREGRMLDAIDIYKQALAVSPRGPEAARAVSGAGRLMIDAGRLDEAASWFGERRDSSDGDIAEAALAGMIRVRLAQKRTRDAAALGEEYRGRFPDGSRKEEVQYLLSNAGRGTR